LKPAKKVVSLIGNTPDLLDWSLVESVDQVFGDGFGHAPEVFQR
jgi:hypothetical protein